MPNRCDPDGLGAAEPAPGRTRIPGTGVLLTPLFGGLFLLQRAGAPAEVKRSFIESNLGFILLLFSSAAVLTALLLTPWRRIFRKLAQVDETAPRPRPATPEGFPLRELSSMLVALFEVADLAAARKAEDGYVVLQSNIQRAEQLVEEGEPAGEELLLLWREAADRYASRYGLQQDLTASVTIRHKTTGAPLMQVRAPSLVSADLRRANLGDADLHGLNLDGASLTGANLIGADLRGSVLTNAFLGDAMLNDANLTHADLYHANLRGASLRGANLTSANLRFANLTGADLEGAVLTGADLTGATLNQARYTPSTRWPAGFEPQVEGALRG